MRSHGWRRGTQRVLCTSALGAGVLAFAAPAAQAAINIDDIRVAETNASVDATFTITRSAGLFAKAVTLSYTTIDGSAKAPGDYAAASGQISFPSTLLGDTQVRQITISVAGDRIDEPDETFGVSLSGPEVSKGVGTATIADDDPVPTVSVNDAPPAPEGGTATFTISLSAPSARDVGVAFATANGTAVAPGDYTARGGNITVPAGATSVNLGVPLVDDAAIEPEERFVLKLGSPVNATLGDATGVGTIIDNDAVATPPPPPPPGTAPPPPPPPSSGIIPIGPGSGPGSTPSTPSTGTSGTTPSTARVGIASPRLKRPATVLVTLSCPSSSGRCSGKLTVFSKPNKRSKLKALRKERRLGRLDFSVPPGGVETKKIALSKADRLLLLRAGRIQVRAYVVAKVGKGSSKARSVSGTLIARTTHS